MIVYTPCGFSLLVEIIALNQSYRKRKEHGFWRQAHLISDLDLII